MIRKKKGFTFIELLVVISILAILVAIILSGISESKSHNSQSERKGKLVEFRLPDDFLEMVSVSISGSGRTNVTYRDTAGNYRTKTYLNAIQGWYQKEILWIPPKKAE